MTKLYRCVNRGGIADWEWMQLELDKVAPTDNIDSDEVWVCVQLLGLIDLVSVVAGTLEVCA